MMDEDWYPSGDYSFCLHPKLWAVTVAVLVLWLNLRGVGKSVKCLDC